MAILTSASNENMPDQLKVDGYTDDDYIKTLRWLGTQYNQPFNNVSLMGVSPTTVNQNSYYQQEYLDNLTYIYGSQTPANYNFFIKDVNGNDTSTPLFRGLDIFKIFNYLNGEAQGLIEPLPKVLNASAYSVGAISAKKEMLDFVNFQIKEKMFLSLLQQEAGYSFKAIDRDFKTQNEIDKFFETAQESMEIAYNRIAKHVTYFNNYQNKLPKAFSNTIVGNLAVICVEYQKGQVYWRVVQPENAIVDYSKSLDVHENDDFGGEVYQMPLTQVLAEWDWTDDEIQELKAIGANSNGAFDMLYTSYATNNLFWFNRNQDTPTVTIIAGQWKSNEMVDGVIKEVLREGKWIGGKWLKDQKISEGQVWSKGDVSRKRLKYIVMTPNLFLGTSISTVSIVKRIANLRDAFLTKVTEMASTPLGRVAIVRASKLPTGLKTPDVIAQMKQAKILVIEGEDTEEGDDGRKMAETLDLTIDPSISSILQIAQYYEQMISDVLNIPAQVRGQITDYTSKSQLQSSQIQSTKGLSYLFKNFLMFEKELLSYSADLFKLLAPNDNLGRENLSLIVGDGMAEMLSMDIVKRMSFEDFLLNLNPNDYNSADKKARLTDLIGQIATSGAPMTVLESYVVAEQAETLTELRNFIETSIFKANQREDAQIQAQQEHDMAKAELASNTQDNIINTQVDASLEKQRMSDRTKLLSESMKLSKQDTKK